MYCFLYKVDQLHIWKASAVLGCPLDTVQMVGERRMVAKLSMMDNESHPMQDTV